MATVDLDKLMSDTVKTLDSVCTFLEDWEELEDAEKGSADSRVPIVMALWKQSVQLESLCGALQLLVKEEKSEDEEEEPAKESGDGKPAKKKSKKKCCHLHSDDTK
jgi:hypothetical protein